MPAAGTAVSAEPAGDVPFAGNAIPDVETANLLTHLDNFADILVADLHRYRNRLARPVVPFPDVDVGTADRRLSNADHDVVVPHLGGLDVGEREAGRTREFGQRLHHVRPLFGSGHVHGP